MQGLNIKSLDENINLLYPENYLAALESVYGFYSLFDLFWNRFDIIIYMC